MALDPDLAEAWASAGGIANARAQYARAEPLLRRAIALNPNYATAHHWLGYALINLGRRDEALASAERAVALDPLSAVINSFWGHARAGVGRFLGDARRAFARGDGGWPRCSRVAGSHFGAAPSCVAVSCGR